LPGSSDVICGIRATGRRVRPQRKGSYSTAHRRGGYQLENKSESIRRVNFFETVPSVAPGRNVRAAWDHADSRWPGGVKPLARLPTFGHNSRRFGHPGQTDVLRAGRNSPPAVRAPQSKPASAFFPKEILSPGKKGQQIRCNSEADGQSPDERERSLRLTQVSARRCCSVCPDSGPERGTP